MNPTLHFVCNRAFASVQVQRTMMTLTFAQYAYERGEIDYARLVQIQMAHEAARLSLELSSPPN